jgi:hypothetical protein
VLEHQLGILVPLSIYDTAILAGMTFLVNYKTKSHPSEWLFGVVRLGRPAIFGQLDRHACGKSFVTQSDQFTAGLAQNVLGHCHTIASFAAVGIDCKAMLTDAADFSGQVANTHFLGFGRGQSFAGLQSFENTERLGFRIDKFHSITFLK